MIITYPIAIPYVKDKQQRVPPDEAYACSEISSGTFPMGSNKFWHGGVHMTPHDPATPIRAIADGELVAYRYDDVDSTDPYFDKVSYSRSFVLLKHEADLGETALGKNHAVFYSLYMHLQPWSKAKTKSGARAVNFHKKLVRSVPRVGKDGSPLLDKSNRPIMTAESTSVLPPIADGACHSGGDCERVRRGDILGFCGSIPDNLSNPSKGLHFEIFFTSVDFLDNKVKAVWGASVLTSDLPVTTKLVTSDFINVEKSVALDADSQALNGYRRIRIGRRSFWVEDTQVEKREVDLAAAKKQGQTVKKIRYFALSDRLRVFKENPGEFRKILQAGTSAVPWIGPWLMPGEFRQENADNVVWVQIFDVEKSKVYWAKKDEIKFQSDADWVDFQKIEESGPYSKDGFIDHAGLQNMISASSASTELGSTSKKNPMHFVVAKHPTEWSSANLEKRFDRVTKEDFGPSRLSLEQFPKLLKHIERLSFWEQIPGLPPPTEIWHAHPIKFIEHISRCMWLSSRELELIYPTTRQSGADISHGTPTVVRERYRAAINRNSFKYGVTNRMRMVHYFSQAAVESKSLNLMLEEETGVRYEGRPDLGNVEQGDGPKFKGRGFKQLTGRYNYSRYWEYRGWIREGIDFDRGWETDSRKKYPTIDNPNKVIEDVFSCIDTAGWYISVLRPAALSAMDRDNIDAVTSIINGGDNGIADRRLFTARLKGVLL